MDQKKKREIRPHRARCTAVERIFGERCGSVATWNCPSGYRCDECAQREMQTIREGRSLISLIAPAEVLISRYVRIN